jgi:branched-subunit amino acid aminotransferase/4-amino-4-deoxychorismate lyase
MRGAQAVFLTNSVRLLMPVVALDDWEFPRPTADGTLRLIAEIRKTFCL